MTKAVFAISLTVAKTVFDFDQRQYAFDLSQRWNKGAAKFDFDWVKGTFDCGQSCY